MPDIVKDAAIDDQSASTGDGRAGRAIMEKIDPGKIQAHIALSGGYQNFSPESITLEGEGTERMARVTFSDGSAIVFKVTIEPDGLVLKMTFRPTIMEFGPEWSSRVMQG